MNLINKINYNFIKEAQKVTEKDSTKWAQISDEFIQEIESKFYQDGTYVDEDGVEQPRMVDLKLVNSISLEVVINELFDNVTGLTFKDRDEAITAYNNKKINATFKNKNYKVVSTLPWLMMNYSFIYALCKENPDIINESEPDGVDNLKVTAYMDNVSETMRDIIEANPDNMDLVVNPTKNLEIII